MAVVMQRIIRHIISRKAATVHIKAFGAVITFTCRACTLLQEYHTPIMWQNRNASELARRAGYLSGQNR